MSQQSTFRKTVKPMLILTNFSLSQATYLTRVLQKNETVFKVYSFIKIILLLLVLWSYWRILFVHAGTWPSSSANLVRLLNFAMITACFTCTTLDSLVKNSKYNELIDKLEKFDTRVNLPTTCYQLTRKQIISFSCFLLTTYTLIVVERIFNQFNPSKNFYYTMEVYIDYCIPLLPSCVNLLNFIVFVSMLQVRLEYINKKLRVNKGRRNCECNGELILKTLRDMCLLHMQLSELAALINQVFGFNVFLCVALFFVQFLTSGYTLIFTFKVAHQPSDIYQSIYATVVYCFPSCALFWWICNSCRGTVREYTKVGQRLHSLFTGGEAEVVHDQIQAFSLQIQHENLEFNAADFFAINYTLIFSIICAFTNYIIILMQFS